ncbi:hypothetical protein SLS63_013892 [Diaporthe eres]|uniref:FAD-binding FR-type domain-containing protein n=1 Tax=Diaporthe eres TaxID=83184 RepID=A0ABR1NM72_DIAER
MFWICTLTSTVIEDRRTDRKDDVISHIWNERDAGVVNMTNFEHLSMIPGLLLAGHETTTNVLSMGLSHLLHNNLWEKVSESDKTRSAAIEELLRYESAITGMWRVVTKETRYKNKVFQLGDNLFVAYNSGSRDSTKFNNPDVIDVDRRPKTQHLGFGRGVHTCLGAPFARLLLRTELSALNERLPKLRLATPYETIKYSNGPEGRGPEAIISWYPPSQQERSRGKSINSSKVTAGKPQDLDMVVSDVVKVASDVMQITLRSMDGVEVPLWTPGAHVDIKAGTFGFRQYSICSDPDDRHVLKIAVLMENNTGASHFIHDTVRQESKMTIRGPRNNFASVPGSRGNIFIAGGTGITPTRSQMHFIKISYLRPSAGYKEIINFTQLLILPAKGGL